MKRFYVSALVGVLIKRWDQFLNSKWQTTVVKKNNNNNNKINNDPVVQMWEVRDYFCVSVVVNWKVGLEI